jgi:hypothetical protein
LSITITGIDGDTTIVGEKEQEKETDDIIDVEYSEVNNEQ